MQRSGGKFIELGRSPAFESRQDDSKQIELANTIWVLVYQPVSSHSMLSGLVVVIAILAGVIIAALMIFLKQLQIKRAINTDLQSIFRIVENKIAGSNKHVLAGNFALKESKEIMQLLSQLDFAQSARPSARKVVVKGDAQSLPTDEAESDAIVFPSSVSQSEADATSLQAIDSADISADIFREYDIRGVVGDTLNLEHAYVIGKAIGSYAMEHGETTMLVARDGRISSKDLSSTLVRGLVETGINVIDLGMMPTPVMYFGTHFLAASSGVVVTGSHNPQSYNGFKVVIAGESLRGDEIQELYQRIISNQFTTGDGAREDQDILPDYISRIVEDIHLLKPMKVIVDCGHGVAGITARLLFEAIGCDVSTLYCEVDGHFPNHHPDPGKPENMQELSAAVVSENADLGIAFDGDGDRLGVIDSSGKLIMPDRVLMLLAGDVLLRNPGVDIVYDVKSSKNLASHILASGGRPIMWKSGHSLMKAKIKETGALLGGEFSGHIFYKERWYGFDDALYAAARLLEVLAGDGRDSTEIFAEIPDSINTHELSLPVSEGVQHDVIHRLQQAGNKAFPNAKLIDIDGIRAEYPGAWGLVRASNTTPALIFRFEAENNESMAKVQEIFRTVIKTVLPNASVPF